jgi:hypothetical protein
MFIAVHERNLKRKKKCFIKEKVKIDVEKK